MSKIDLTKMVEDWAAMKYQADDLEGIERQYFLVRVLKAMAAEIEANTEEIEKLKNKTKYMR